MYASVGKKHDLHIDTSIVIHSPILGTFFHKHLK